MKNLFKTLLLIVCALDLYSDEVIKNARIIDVQSSKISSPKEITIKKESIYSIKDYQVQKKDRNPEVYIIPSFCDAYATIGSDSMGGQLASYGIHESLKQFIKAGFTHVHSIADGPWIKNIQSDIRKGKLIGPDIIISDRPILPASSETDGLSSELYFAAKSQEEALSELQRQAEGANPVIHVFHRYKEDTLFTFDSELLYRMKLEADKKKKKLLVSAFADKFSISNTFVSGNNYISHPVFSDSSFTINSYHAEQLKYIPLLNVYKNLTFGKNEKTKTYLENLQSVLPQYKDRIAGLLQSSQESEDSEEDIIGFEANFEIYNTYLQANKSVLMKNIILGSGSGYKMSFPGFSGLTELMLLSNYTNNPIDLIKIAAGNTCSFLNPSNKGIIAAGNEANLIFLSSDPMVNTANLFRIQKVIKRGKVLYDLTAGSNRKR